MSNSLYITSAQAHAGKTAVALGVLDMLARNVAHIGLFRPIVANPDGTDAMVDLLLTRYNIDQAPADTYGMTYAEAATYFESGQQEKVIERAVEKFAALKSKYEFMVVIGTDYLGAASATELDLNAQLAANLGTPVLLIVSGHLRSIDDIIAATGHSRHTLQEHDCAMIATVINRVDPKNADDVLRQLKGRAELGDQPVFILRDLPVLAALTVEEVAHGIKGTILVGSGEEMQREVERYVAGSSYVPRVLGTLVPGALLVCSGDRSDLLVAAAAVANAPDWPSVSGLVLTCNERPDPLTMKLLQSAKIPTIAVEPNTYDTLHLLDQLHGDIHAKSRRKIAAALGEFAAQVDDAVLLDRIRLSRATAVTPLMFQSTLMERARGNKQRIVLPEGTDDRILRAADEILQVDICDLTLLGDPEEVRARAARLGLDLSSADIIDPKTSPLFEEFAEKYAELRTHKGVSLKTARERMEDPNFFGTMLVYTGRANGMVSGAAHTTAETVRPALQIIKTVPGTSLVSSAFLMCMPDEVLAFADCAITVDPTVEQLAQIALSTVDTAVAFGIDPKVAMLSYSTGTSGTGTDVDKVRAATEIVANARPELPLAGPIQYDAAVDPSVGASKMPGNPVAGHATVLIFPDLNSGNTAYKAVQRSADAIAIGPILQGLKKPVNDLSRGCTVPDIVNTVAITAIQAASIQA